MKLCRGFSDPQRMSPTDYGGPPDVSFSATCTFYVSNEKWQHLLDGLAQDFVQTFVFSRC